MEMTVGIANEDDSVSDDAEWWNGLPECLQVDVLAWLPADSLLTYRRVCRQWNALLSSRKFLRDLWVNAPVNRKPWLILWPQSSRERCQAYSFYRGTWEPSFSLSFLSRHDDRVYLRGSAAGRLLVVRRGSFYVCNPYRRKSIQLPRMTSAPIFATVLANDNNNNGIYNVVFIGWRTSSNTQIVEIYNSSVNSWTIAGEIPSELDVIDNMTFCDGYFYCFSVQRLQPGPGRMPRMLVFSIQGGVELRICVLSPWPDILVNSPGSEAFLPFITCGSRLLVVTVQPEPNGLIIWEFRRNSSPLWEEIARMPPDIRARLTEFSDHLSCQGVGDCICFISMHGTAAIVCVFYLDSKLWRWIPSCELGGNASHDIHCMAFHPRPDMRPDMRIR